MLKITELSATALGKSSRPAISMTNASRAGRSRACTTPLAAVTASICQTVSTPAKSSPADAPGAASDCKGGGPGEALASSLGMSLGYPRRSGGQGLPVLAQNSLHTHASALIALREVPEDGRSPACHKNKPLQRRGIAQQEDKSDEKGQVISVDPDSSAGHHAHARSGSGPGAREQEHD